MNAQAVALPPQKPFPGIEAYRFRDREVFFARDAESSRLLRLITIYRGVLLYGDSGCGKSSLVDAGLMPLARRENFAPHRLRVHPELGREFVVERIRESPAGNSPYLPSIFGSEDGRLRELSVAEFKGKLTPYRMSDLSERIESCLRQPSNPLSSYLAERVDSATREFLRQQDEVQKPSSKLRQDIAELLRRALADPELGAPDNIRGLQLSEETRRLAEERQRAQQSALSIDYTAALNQRLLEEAFQPQRPPIPQTPLLIFDQFEEFVTLFEIEPRGEQLRQALEAQEKILDALAELMHDGALAIKLLFVFREDYLAKLNKLFLRCPELPDQYLRLTPPAPEKLPEIIRGPFRKLPGVFGREISEALAERLGKAINEKNEGGPINLSEVQIICRRLWESPDPESLFAQKEAECAGVQGLLECYLEDIVDHLDESHRPLALAVLGRLITSSPTPTRNIVGEPDLIADIVDSEKTDQQAVAEAIRALLETRLIVSELRHNIPVYGIVSEFLVPWIIRKRARRKLEQAKRDLYIRLARTLGLNLNADPERNLLLAIEAASMTYNSEKHMMTQVAEETLRWTLQASRIRRTLRRPSTPEPVPVNAVCFSSDGSRIATACADGFVLVWDACSGQVLLPPIKKHDAPINGIAFHPKDTQRVVTASADHLVKVWDASTGGDFFSPIDAQSQQLNAVSFSPDGALLATAGADGTAKIWDSSQGHYLSTIQQHGAALNGLAFNPLGGSLATAGADGTVRIFEIGINSDRGLRWRELRDIHAHNAAISGVAFSPDGSRLATAGGDGIVCVWDVDSGLKLIRDIK
jgi:WD domain, G-beta repeat